MVPEPLPGHAAADGRLPGQGLRPRRPVGRQGRTLPSSTQLGSSAAPHRHMNTPLAKARYIRGMFMLHLLYAVHTLR
ncbi:hypothetical protein SMG44B_10882 [Stenotrophomonas maltophilia]